MPIAAGIHKGRQTTSPSAIDLRATDLRAIDLRAADLRASRSGLAGTASIPSPGAPALRPRIFLLGRRRLARRPVRTGAPARAATRRSDAGRAAVRRALHS